MAVLDGIGAGEAAIVTLDWEPVGWGIPGVGFIGAGVVWTIGSIQESQNSTVHMAHPKKRATRNASGTGRVKTPW
jgi:hypothetical protein